MTEQRTTKRPEEIFTAHSVNNVEFGISTVEVCSSLPFPLVVARVNAGVSRRHPDTYWQHVGEIEQCPDKPNNKHYKFMYDHPEKKGE